MVAAKVIYLIYYLYKKIFKKWFIVLLPSMMKITLRRLLVERRLNWSWRFEVIMDILQRNRNIDPLVARTHMRPTKAPRSIMIQPIKIHIVNEHDVFTYPKQQQISRNGKRFRVLQMEPDKIDKLVNRYAAGDLSAQKRNQIEALESPPNDAKDFANLEETEKTGEFLEGEWLIPTSKDLQFHNRVILYIHGGGFNTCSMGTHRNMVGKLAIAAQCKVLIFDYRLAPEHKFPVQIEDCITAFHWLQSKEGGAYSPSNIIIAGDSAGGNLTVSTCLLLRQRGHNLPRGLAIISPWLDLTCSSEAWATNAKYDYLPDAVVMKNWTKSYLGQKISAKYPFASPVYADKADLTNFPPVLIQVSDKEQLYEDSVRFAEKLKSCGVSVKLEVFADQPHVFQCFGQMIPESRAAIQNIGKWVLDQFYYNMDTPVFKNEGNSSVISSNASNTNGNQRKFAKL